MGHFQQHFFVKKVSETFYSKQQSLNILEVGSYLVNQSIRDLFPNSKFVGYDLINGPNVEVVYDGKEIKSNKTFDISISCECFEHNPYFLENFHQMINLTKDSGLVIITCATTGRLEHGTSSSAQKFDYYKNLTPKDFGKKNRLLKIFNSYHIFINHWTRDLYFIGQKKGPTKFDLKSFAFNYLEYNSIVSIKTISIKEKLYLFLKNIILTRIISMILPDIIFRKFRIILKKII